MTDQRPAAADIEILERAENQAEDGPGSVLVPNEVRINGRPVYTSAHHPVTVHEIDVGPGESSMVLVTLTLIANRVRIDREPG